jgi:hypothetical protein
MTSVDHYYCGARGTYVVANSGHNSGGPYDISGWRRRGGVTIIAEDDAAGMLGLQLLLRGVELVVHRHFL